MNEAKIIQVIYTVSPRGEGTPDSPARLVEQYWLPDGKLLFEHDSFAEKRSIDWTSVWESK